jgi:thiol-disulfide isomerase/thioredoxin
MKFPAALLGCLLAAAAQAADPPQLGARGIDSYREYRAAEPHRAFVVAPGGAWAWHAGAPSRERAEQLALDDCRANTDQTCVPYALDDSIVFDAKAWPRLWGPYADESAARRAPVGVRRGERFPDLLFRDGAGRALKLSDLRGRVLVLHFWGSWCGPCRRELPDLQRLVRRLEKQRDIRFVFLPVREPFAVARDWARSQQLDLPLYDAGSGESFALADGTALPDRRVAGKFPTTYVLDKRGIVVFSHVGDASRWEEYAPFLQDAAARSGK